MSATCPKCHKGLTVKEVVTNLHSCISSKLKSQALHKLKLSKGRGNTAYVRANFDALLAAALKNS